MDILIQFLVSVAGSFVGILLASVTVDRIQRFRTRVRRHK